MDRRLEKTFSLHMFRTVFQGERVCLMGSITDKHTEDDKNLGWLHFCSFTGRKGLISDLLCKIWRLPIALSLCDLIISVFIGVGEGVTSVCILFFSERSLCLCTCVRKRGLCVCLHMYGRDICLCTYICLGMYVCIYSSGQKY